MAKSTIDGTAERAGRGIPGWGPQFARQAARVAYAARQAARVTWYAGQLAATRRMAGPLAGRGKAPFRPSAPMPSRRDLAAAMAELFASDRRNIEQGLYAPPPLLPSHPLRRLAQARAYLADAARVDARRRAGEHSEVLDATRSARYPRYYLQNFHYQTGGWLDDASAALYDTQVEVLFSGTADAMRRQQLVPVAHFLRGRDQRRIRLLDVGTGTGRALHALCRTWPGLRVTALDLSPNYLARAHRQLARHRRIRFVQANAEAMPLADASQDLVVCSYLFHELPPRVRRTVAREMARVLRPDGRLVLLDALQRGDRPRFDPLLEFFPWAFHEPYFESYTRTDMAALFAAAGLRPGPSQTAFLSKVMSFDKPGSPA